jgi:GrpB-like predicted nucleotidyltransferase (UPF0157 family)
MIDPIIIEEYDKTWQQEFETIRGILMNALKNLAVGIEHVGSTSVKRLPSEPILDIDIIIANYKSFDPVKETLIQIGYRHLPKESIPGKEAFEGIDLFAPFQKNMRIWMKQKIYVCHALSPELKKHLIFRDYLRTHDRDRLAYGKLKVQFAKKYTFSREKYNQMKLDFVNKILIKTGFIEKRYQKQRKELATEDKIVILKRIADQFNQTGIVWAVGGSAMLYFFEIVDRFDDVDIQVKESDYEVAKKILEQLGTHKIIPQSFRFKTKQFTKFVVSGVVIDLMGGLKVRKNKVWHEISFADDIVDKKIMVGQTEISLGRLVAWLHYYDLMERYAKVRMIEDFLSGKRY